MEKNQTIKTFVFIIVALVVLLIVFIVIKKNKAKDIIISDDGYVYSDAYVEEIDVILRESFPVSVDVLVKGNLPDACSELSPEIKQQLVGDTFYLKLESRKSKDAEVCAQVLVDFETTVSLSGVVGISAGDYTVDVNGIKKTFKMDVDNYISNFDPLK